MVNFSDKLTSNRVVEWSEFYVNYDELKKLIKKIGRKLSELEDLSAIPATPLTKNRHSASLIDVEGGVPTPNSYGTLDIAVDLAVNGPDPDEDFYVELEKEAKKVEGFYVSKCQELSERLDHAKDSVRRLKEKYLLDDKVAGASSSPRVRKRVSSDDVGRGEPMAESPLFLRKRTSAVDHSESDDDGDSAGLHRDLHAKASLKRSFVDIYRQMNYLQSYATLNYTAFVKITKKHDKVTKRSGKKRAMAIVQSYSFGEAEEIKELIEELEKMFAAAFHHRNLTVARNDLLTKNRPLDNMEMLHLGFRFGVVVTLIFWVLWVIGMDALIKPSAVQISASVFIVYRGMSTLILAVWLWALCLYVWESARVNYVYLFEFDPRDYVTPYTVARRASTMTIVYLMNILFFVKITRGELLGMHPSSASFLPLLLFAYVFVMVLYTRLGGSGITALGSVLMSPFVEVTFFHSFVADVMTSLVRPFVDIAFSLCFFFSGEWQNSNQLKVKDPSGSICMNSWFYQSIVVPFVISLPLWFRFAQCLRRYYDTGKRNPNLLNATKYAIAYSVVLFGALRQPEGQEAENFHRAWYFAATSSSLITFSWDVLKDWGLFNSGGCVLRDRLLYPTWAYAAAIILDFGLRFLWTLTLFPSVAAFFAGGAAPGLATADYSPLSMYLTALLSWAEASRRCMWAFFRVEHEHLANAFGFRRVDFVPLHFDSPLEHESEDVKKQMSIMNKLGFFTELFLFAGMMLSVAAYTFHWQITIGNPALTQPPTSQ